MNLSSTQVAQQKLQLYSNQPQWTYMMSNPFNTVINPNVPKMNPNDASMYLMNLSLYYIGHRLYSEETVTLSLNKPECDHKCVPNVSYKPQLSKMSENSFGIEYNNRIFVQYICSKIRLSIPKLAQVLCVVNCNFWKKRKKGIFHHWASFFILDKLKHLVR